MGWFSVHKLSNNSPKITQTAFQIDIAQNKQNRCFDTIPLCCVEAFHGNSNHCTWIIHAELEPILLSKICIQTLKSSTIIFLVKMSISKLTDRVRSNVGFPVNISSFDYPAVMRSGEVNGRIRRRFCGSHIISSDPPIVTIDRGSLLVVYTINPLLLKLPGMNLISFKVENLLSWKEIFWGSESRTESSMERSL